MVMTTLRILVVDDHDVVRRGVRAVLETQADWQIVGEASNGKDAVDQVQILKPDVIVLDLRMPVMNGLEATRKIRKLAPDTEVLILTIDESEQVVREVVDAGARGYLLKTDAGRFLVTAVETLARHQPFFASKVSEMLSMRKDARADGTRSA
jgi:DNA-binding NarL/FixJ family response regulator